MLPDIYIKQLRSKNSTIRGIGVVRKVFNECSEENTVIQLLFTFIMIVFFNNRARFDLYK